MKKVILTTAVLVGINVSSQAQGIAFADNSTRSYDTAINGVPNTTQNLNLELLLGTSSGDVNVDVVTLLLSSSAEPTGSDLVPFGGVYSAAGDISALGGLIYDNSGASYDARAYAGQTVYLEIFLWTGNYSSYSAAQASGTSIIGESQIFTTVVPSTPTGFPADISNVGIINIVAPEPSIMALAGLGGLALLFLRRKNKQC